ncbi:MAG: hypothetical protein N3F64_06310 [Nitrososphaeria archaeon]|nr:hypothetical protein [Nitrososphaeria archaeon]
MLRQDRRRKQNTVMLEQKMIKEHYLREDVVKEIVKYCSGRWCAFLIETEEGSKIVRYDKRIFRPIVLDNIEKFREYTKIFFIRTVYGTIHFYKKIEYGDDVRDLTNIIASEPVWDIDNILFEWKKTVQAAKIIIEFLESKGISKSIYVKWSGKGIHIHLNKNAISKEVYSKIHPLDAAYSVVEYVKEKVEERILELKSDSLKVENKIDPQRLFTAPLTFHKSLNFITVCIDPEKLDDFTIEYANPQKYVHYPNWNNFVEGEADQLVFEAYKSVGAYPREYLLKKRKRRRLDEEIRRWQNYISSE